MCKDILTVCVINLHVLAVLNWYRHLFILKLLCLFSSANNEHGYSNQTCMIEHFTSIQQSCFQTGLLPKKDRLQWNKRRVLLNGKGAGPATVTEGSSSLEEGVYIM